MIRQHLGSASARVGSVLGLVSLVAVPLLGDSSGAEQPTPRYVSLVSTEPLVEQAVDSSDLGALSEWLTGATVVGLGESVHGTHTLHRLGHRIFAHLVKEEGFTVFASEIDQAHARELDAYVQGRRDDLDELLAGGWWAQKIFYDQALVDLLRWLRRYNETAERPVHFAGYDVKQPKLAIDRLLQAVSTLAPEEAEELRDLYDTAMAPGAFGIFPNISGFTATVPVPLAVQSVASGLRIEVRVRGDRVTRGEVGISTNGSTASLRGNRTASIESLTQEGTILALDLEVPPGEQALDLSFFHRGNGSVDFAMPQIIRDGVPEPAPSFDTLSVRPLMSPVLQVMDYDHKIVVDSDGSQWLRVVHDPSIESALAVARRAERMVKQIVTRESWLRRYARLIEQAVEWRTLVEPNRDVFLAENLLWLREHAFLNQRIVALGHMSHTERRPRKMGFFLAEALGEEYRTLSMLAGSGEYLYYGDVATTNESSPLENYSIDPEKSEPLVRALSSLSPGDVVAHIAPLAATPSGRAWRDRWTLGDKPLPDVAILVGNVLPLRWPGGGSKTEEQESPASKEME